MRRRWHHHALAGRRRGQGQALVEFAFVFPVIVLLAFGFVDVGRAVFSYNTLTNAARQAARTAAVNQLDPASPGPYECDETRPIEDPAAPHWTFRGCAISAGSSIGLKATDVKQITYTAPPGTTIICAPPPLVHVGCIASVTVTYQFRPITPVAGSVIGPILFTTTSQMPVERVFP
jgi:TadE-like protein